jgi:hypothetical protein
MLTFYEKPKDFIHKLKAKMKDKLFLSFLKTRNQYCYNYW